MFKLIGVFFTRDGVYLTLQDAQETFFGNFCWSREQVEGLLTHLHEEKAKEEIRTYLKDSSIPIYSSDEPISIRGICAYLLHVQFQKILQFRETHDHAEPKHFNARNIILTLFSEKNTKEHGVLIYFSDAECVVTLAHVRSKAQNAELLQRMRFPADQTQILREACKDLPTIKENDRKPTLISQSIIADLVAWQIALTEEQARFGDVN